MLDRIIEAGRAGYTVVFNLDYPIDLSDPESEEVWRADIVCPNEEPSEGIAATLKEAFDEAYSDWRETLDAAKEESE